LEKEQQQIYDAEQQKQQQQKKKKKKVLSELAYKLHQKQELSISAVDLYEHLKQTEPGISSHSELLAEIEERTGLLYRISEDEYAFRHLSIQEYFTSLAVVDHPERVERLIAQMEEPWWREVVALLVGQKTVAPKLFNTLIRGSTASTNGLLLAVACLNENIDLPSDLRQEIIVRVVNWLHNSTDYLRLHEIGGLDRTLGDEIWSKVAGWLREDNPEIRLRASV